MSDRFLDQRRDPRPEFTRELRQRLARETPEPARPRRSWPARLLRPALAAAPFAALAVALAVSPTVRAYAQAFLDLFRVRNFAAVSMDASRIEELRGRSLDLEHLLGDDVQVLAEPGPPQVYPDPAAAGAAAGFAVRVPATPPSGLERDTVRVQGSGAARITVDTAKLRELLDALDLRDVAVPAGLQGAQVSVRIPASVSMQYRRGELRVMLVQAPSPEVELPVGLDLAELGEIGLRVVGLEPADARRLARTIDWRSTLLVPVPSDVDSFREVDVRGNRGVLISHRRPPAGPEGRPRRGAVLLWAEGGMVYALGGNVAGDDLLTMAYSMR